VIGRCKKIFAASFIGELGMIFNAYKFNQQA